MGNREQVIGNSSIKKMDQMSEINDFKDLRIWQKGMEIAEKCYIIIFT